MYYGVLTKIVGGMSTEEIKQQDFLRQLDGRARITYPFRVVGLNGEEHDCNACCYAPSPISEDETVWLHKVDPNLLDYAWSGFNASSTFMVAKGPDNHVWRMSGHVGFIDNPDGYMHELFFAEYDSTAGEGIALIAIEEETVRDNLELFDNVQLAVSPCSDNTLIEAAAKWGMAPLLYKMRMVQNYQASQRKS